ncbi:MAG: hypothetical protein NT078_02075, partial [Candidatus Azambacteria bacterium]|nr:hypothetical protein [Candidatus Azambacteria bacterium]
LEKEYPYLTQVAFNSEIRLFMRQVYTQFFSGLPGLRSSSKSQIDLLEQACVKWPFENCYALCPLPSWQADHTGEELWFRKYTWPEQLNEIKRLQRKFPGVTVRLANLPELIYLDFCMRLAVGESPFGIFSYRCEHPTDDKKCLAYGHVGDYGGEIEIDKKPESEYPPVMPLFFLRAKPDKK